MAKEIITFRSATQGDVPLILQFINELARYEKMENQVVATEALLEEWLFDKQIAEVLFAVVGTKEIGFALYFHNFSYLFRPCRHLSGRLICFARISRLRVWQAYFTKASSNRHPAGLRTAGMVLSGLE